MGFYAFANLDQATLEEVKSLEERIGKPLVAMEEVELKPAKISDEDVVAKIKSLEGRLGVALVAVER